MYGNGHSKLLKTEKLETKSMTNKNELVILKHLTCLKRKVKYRNRKI